VGQSTSRTRGHDEIHGSPATIRSGFPEQKLQKGRNTAFRHSRLQPLEHLEKSEGCPLRRLLDKTTLLCILATAEPGKQVRHVLPPHPHVRKPPVRGEADLVSLESHGLEMPTPQKITEDIQKPLSLLRHQGEGALTARLGEISSVRHENRIVPGDEKCAARPPESRKVIDALPIHTLLKQKNEGIHVPFRE
jgi:hypothetical protein